MKKLLLIFFFLSAFPQFAKAENVYLILNNKWINSISTNVIPMETMEKCELQGAKLKSSNRFDPDPLGLGIKKGWHSVGYECIRGK